MTRRAVPLWGAALLVFAASRVWSTGLLAGSFLLAKSNDWTFASDRISRSLLTYFGSWDASFYRRIAEHGYPSTLPMVDGHVVPNEWAFLPVFPSVVRALMWATGLDAEAAGVVVAIVAAAGASVVLALLLEPRVGRTVALWTVAIFTIGPLGFVLQVPYAESLFCLLIFGSLLALAARRYWLVTLLGVVAAFTRPGELALPLAIGILFLARRRRRSDLACGEAVWMIVTAAVTAVAGLAWPFIAAAVTGRSDAYLATELSWWTGYVGRPPFVPLSPWFIMAGRYLGVIGALLVLIVIGLAAWWLVRHRRSALGPEILGFSSAYALYLLAVFLPQQSLFRLVMPLAPLLGDSGLARTRPRRTVALVVAAALQVPAVFLLWFAGYP